MKTIQWIPEKNQIFMDHRGVGFEDVIVAIKEGRLLDTMKHPNHKRYPNQFIFIVKIQGYPSNRKTPSFYVGDIRLTILAYLGDSWDSI